MGETSKVEWTDSSWSPWYGCHKVSQGCAHCYAYREMAKYGKQPNIVTRSKTTFRAPLSWAKKKANWGKKIFVCPWSDFWIEEADPWREEALHIMRQTPMFTYIVPSKRLERVPDHLPGDWGAGWEHVWLGASIEDQAAADLRVPLLLRIPCKTRFLSCEPLLGEIDSDLWIVDGYGGYRYNALTGEEWPFTVEPILGNKINWVIAGGESGSDARPCHPDWMRSLRNQCEQASVPFFFKSWGEYIPAEPPAEQRYTMPVEFIRVGRKQSGCMLDGREWHQYPSIE
jgi:protein gp37